MRTNYYCSLREGVVAALAMASFFGVSCAKVSKSSGVPKLQVPLEVDAGRFIAPDAQQVEATIPFRNDGDSPLEVRMLSKSCGCAEVSKSEFSIAPDDVMSVVAKVKPGQGLGQESVALKFGTNDPKRPIVELRVLWTRESLFHRSADTLTLSRRDSQLSGSLELSWRQSPIEGFKLSRIRTWPEDLQAKFIPAKSPGRLFGTIEVQLPIAFGGRETSGNVEVDFGDGSQFETFVVRWPDLSPVRLEPSVVVFRELEPGTSATRSVRIASDSEFKVIDSISSNSNVKVVIESGRPRRTVACFVTLSLPKSSSRFSGHVDIRIQASNQQVIRLPVFAFVKENKI